MAAADFRRNPTDHPSLSLPKAATSLSPRKRDQGTFKTQTEKIAINEICQALSDLAKWSLQICNIHEFFKDFFGYRAPRKVLAAFASFVLTLPPTQPHQHHLWQVRHPSESQDTWKGKVVLGPFFPSSLTCNTIIVSNILPPNYWRARRFARIISLPRSEQVWLEKGTSCLLTWCEVTECHWIHAMLPCSHFSSCCCTGS